MVKKWENIRDDVAGMLADGESLENIIGKLEEMKNEMQKPMTNEEWFRIATMEELAEWFGNWHSFSCVFCKHWKNGCVYNHNQVRCAIEEGKSNKELWMEWLKQPHTD